MYKETSDKLYLDLLVENMDKEVFNNGSAKDYIKDISEEDISFLGIGTVSTFLFDETGDFRYRELADLLYDKLKSYLNSDGKDVNALTINDFNVYMPFYTDYETRWNKKNGYNDICDRFSRAFELINNKGADDITITDKIFFLKSVVDSLSVISIQIYEDYRLLEDILRQSIKDIFFEKKAFDKVLELDGTGRKTASYILLKSIRNGHISSEKYRPLAEELLKD
jgi:hypothetical protein